MGDRERRNPGVSRRRLAAELRRLRERSGLDVGEVARRCGWSPAHVARMETGAAPIRATDIRCLADLYHLTDTERAALTELAERTAANSWWSRFSDVLQPEFVDLEQDASRIRLWEPLLVPAPLRTDAYLCACARAVQALDGPDLDQLATAQSARRSAVLGESRVSLDAVIGEAVLNNAVGGPQVLRTQLEFLLHAARLPAVTLRVVPFTAHDHPGHAGGFSVLTLAGATPGEGGEDVVIHTELSGAGAFFGDHDGVARQAARFTWIEEAALSSRASCALIQRYLNR
ncbi:transcriptional regulator with XRE-family HTH domain [Nocardiopsis mwathae]|uniref:Transcriptional regulator with XRE-family HTH domain n=1 Tax=Nocardiopsis mwathae TaxID=1472723 RepID=A0A7W9YFF5_9ACTN|nr:helix-turn-helix transcriptional regulator [Nocardiopsis mwathae]MBB6171089.1 transcriptional regulator with XRE-family HTH domain [Nocardiopsis mwathae]